MIHWPFSEIIKFQRYFVCPQSTVTSHQAAYGTGKAHSLAQFHAV